MSGFFPRLGARAIRATMLVDRGYSLFDRGRSRVVAVLAGDDVLDAYNDLTYGASRVYDAGEAAFRSELFNWEADFVARVLPPPPGRILIGGAGGGREAFALAEQGYQVVAFEPSDVLARSMADKAKASAAAVDAYIGRYEQLPVVERADRGQRVDLRVGLPFDASILGWASYSHVRSRPARIATLKAFAEITRGPVVLSFYLRRAPRGSVRPGRLARFADAIGLHAEGDRFTPHVGFFHLSAPTEIEEEIAEAGLRIAHASWDDSDGHWPWIAAVRPQPAGPAPDPAPAS